MILDSQIALFDYFAAKLQKARKKQQKKDIGWESSQIKKEKIKAKEKNKSKKKRKEDHKKKQYGFLKKERQKDKKNKK